MVGRQGHRGMPASKSVEEGAVRELAAGLRGELLRPEEDGYDDARAVFNGMIEKRPAMIVRCAGAPDEPYPYRMIRRYGVRNYESEGGP